MNVQGRIQGKTAAEIAESVRDLVDSAQLTSGDALPPVRALASELGVNRNTVVSAYGILVQAGVAQTRGRAGTRITQLPEVAQEGVTPGAGASTAVDLGSGNPDPEFLPSPATALTRLAKAKPVLYGESVVDPELAQWARTTLDADRVKNFELTVTAGSADAMERLLTASLASGDSVGYEQPCFLTSISTAQASGYKPVAIPVDPEGPTVEGVRNALEAGVRALIVTPRAHNPTGSSISEHRAEQLREVLTGYPHVLIIEDDHFWQLATHPYHSITPAGHPRWALVRSVSKSLGPDLRLALVASDASTAARLGERIRSGSMWVSHLLQKLTVLLATDEQAQHTIATARDHYAERNQTLIEALSAQGIQAWATDGLNVWIDVDADGEVVTQRLSEAGWLVRAGSSFSLESDAHVDRFIRVTVHHLSPDQFQHFAADLARSAHDAPEKE